jgi:hypothetical protein
VDRPQGPGILRLRLIDVKFGSVDELTLVAGYPV